LTSSSPNLWTTSVATRKTPPGSSSVSRLTFAGVNIVTLAEGDITHLHIEFKGTMNAMFLKDLAAKTHRGLRGRIELGTAGGGVSFGYRIVRRLENGLVTTGEREIVPEEAAIVRRIFDDYAAGASPKQIAKALNAERVRGPRGRSGAPARFIEARSVASAFSTTSSTSAVWYGIASDF
jgi:site-specific DNA recombinase